MPQVSPINAFNDNYIWMIQTAAGAIVVDPGDAAPVLQRLTELNLPLIAVLITHHHADHIGGVRQLRQAYPDLRVYGPASETLAESDVKLSDGDNINLAKGELSFDILGVPGHTLGHIAYYGEGWLFCGDTLFSGGCGRLFEGSPQQMYHSLQKLAALPAETALFPAHEYTLANLNFALAIEPDNAELLAYQQAVKAIRKKGEPSLPSTLGREKSINPFLRVEEITVKRAVNHYLDRSVEVPWEIFAGLRDWKDKF